MSQQAPPAPELLVGADTEQERRAVERHRSLRNPQVRLLVKPSFQAHRGVVRDISQAGIGLLLRRPFDPGTVLAVEFRKARQGMSGILSARVVHATPQPDGSWLVGGPLSRRLTEDEVWALL